MSGDLDEVRGEIRALVERIDTCEALISQMMNLIARNQEMTIGTTPLFNQILSLMEKRVGIQDTQEDLSLPYFQ